MAATYEGSHLGALYFRGNCTHRVPPLLHRSNRESAMRNVARLSGSDQGLVFLQGGRDEVRHNTDHEHLFRQESFFHYLFGVEESDCCALIDVQTCKTTLFVPKLPESHAVWMGSIPGLDVFKAKYGVDDVLYSEDLAGAIERLNPARVHLLSGKNTDSGLEMSAPDLDRLGLTSLDKGKVETGALYQALCESRGFKNPHEVEVMKYVSKISSQAHIDVMRACKPGMMEYQLESTFLHSCYFNGGCRFSSYTSIVGAGEHGAILHYGHSGAPNAGEIPENALVLCDMGAEYHGYAADITCTFPSSGKFTAEQATVYNSVLAAHTQVIEQMKPGVSWPDMHTLAEKVILQGLTEGGFLKGSVDDMMASNLGSVFMPHGLGHLIGIDTHDCGGYGPGYPSRPERDGANKLRTARTLEEGMVITVEPGCYFNTYLLNKAFENPEFSKFLQKEKLLANMKLGGVRIEDNILITAGGCESFTHVPRTTKEIEAVMAGKEWPF